MSTLPAKIVAHFVAILIAAAALTTSSRAATVEYILEVNPDTETWELFAEASLGDNLGLASVAVSLANVDPTIDLLLPTGVFAPTIFGGGFSENRVANPAVTIGGGQDFVGGVGIVEGFGQTGGDLAVELASLGPPPGFIQQVYDAKLLVATGAFASGNPATPTITSGDAGVFISVSPIDIKTSQDQVDPLTIITSVVTVPEPHGACLLACCAAALTARRRR